MNLHHPARRRTQAAAPTGPCRKTAAQHTLRHGAQRLRAAALAACVAGTPGFAAAFDATGSRSIVAVTADGTRTPIGSVQFTPLADGGATFRLTWKTEAFTDHFLSMREFKCLPGPREISCHVPYPYANPGVVSAGQWAWLEHALLFLYKTPAEFGARLWNGIYFELREQGDALVGVPMAVDLNEIAAPPANPALPPFKRSLRHDMPAGARWITQLRIE